MTDDTPEQPQDKLPAKDDGRFKPGEAWKGNSAGRAKGTKNRITLQRLLLEERLRERLEVDAEEILVKAIEMAKSGDDKIMRTLLDKLLTTPKNAEDDTGKDTSIHVTISDLSSANPKMLTAERGTERISIPTARVIEHDPGDSEK